MIKYTTTQGQHYGHSPLPENNSILRTTDKDLDTHNTLIGAVLDVAVEDSWEYLRAGHLTLINLTYFSARRIQEMKLA